MIYSHTKKCDCAVLPAQTYSGIVAESYRKGIVNTVKICERTPKVIQQTA